MRVFYPTNQKETRYEDTRHYRIYYRRFNIAIVYLFGVFYLWGVLNVCGG